MDLFEQFKNPGKGTYDGCAMLAALTGRPESEVVWKFFRLSQLMRIERKTRDEAIAIATKEAEGRPWLKVMGET